MHTVVLSSKHRITIPAEIMRKLGIVAGDMLVAELEGDRLVLVKRPRSLVEAVAGWCQQLPDSPDES